MLCALKRDSTKFNTDHLKGTQNPIARCHAINSPGAGTFDDDHAQGLKNNIYVSNMQPTIIQY